MCICGQGGTSVYSFRMTFNDYHIFIFGIHSLFVNLNAYEDTGYKTTKHKLSQIFAMVTTFLPIWKIFYWGKNVHHMKRTYCRFSFGWNIFSIWDKFWLRWKVFHLDNFFHHMTKTDTWLKTITLQTLIWF